MAWWNPTTWGRGSASMPAVEAKVAVPAPINHATQGVFQAFLSPQEITPFIAWNLYKNVAPFAKVVDLIADEVSRLEPMVRIDGQVVEDHPILAYLKKPGFNRTRQRLIKELAVQYLVTGTAYPVVFGNVAVQDFPIAIDVAKSHFISTIQDYDMWPRDYLYSEGLRTQNFTRDRSNPRDFRWYEMTQGMPLAELVPIYDMDGDRRGVGLPRLNAIKYDVELRLKGIQHNSSLMDNGARLSGVLGFKQGLTKEQELSVRDQVQQMMSGATNAGRLLVTGGGEFDFEPLSQNAKDMDFVKLIEIVEDAIVSRYNVPITLFRTSAQTNNNYETAWKFFYNMAMLPCFEVIYSGLAQIFTERLGVNVEIVHNALTNPVLSAQALEKATKLKQNNMVSLNEARDIVGMEPVLGGDTIYGPMGEVPRAEDYFTNHGINEPPAPEEDNSREAYLAARPMADPVNRVAAEEGARAAARGEADKDADKKPGSGAKKPDKSKDKKAYEPDKNAVIRQEKAVATLLQFAEIFGKSTGPPSAKIAA